MALLKRERTGRGTVGAVEDVGEVGDATEGARKDWLLAGVTKGSWVDKGGLPFVARTRPGAVCNREDGRLHIFLFDTGR